MRDLNYLPNRRLCECSRVTVCIQWFAGKLAVNYLPVVRLLSTPATSSGTWP